MYIVSVHIVHIFIYIRILRSLMLRYISHTFHEPQFNKLYLVNLCDFKKVDGTPVNSVD